MATTLHPVGGALRRIFSDGRPIERVAYLVGAGLFASGLAHLVVLTLSGGSWLGPLSLRKAATFGLSFGLTLATVVWATSYVRVRPGVRTLLVGVFTSASVVETVLVSMQAWRGVPSHFNFETPFDTAVSMTLAGGGGVIILTALSFTVAAMAGEGAMSPSMRLAVRFGLLALLVALGVGAMMIASGVTEARTGNPQTAYVTAGSLKPIHAVAMHGILVLPGLAWLLGFTDWTERRRLRLVGTGVAAYAALMAVVAVESFTGAGPFSASPTATGASVVALAVLAATGGTALRAVLRRA